MRYFPEKEFPPYKYRNTTQLHPERENGYDISLEKDDSRDFDESNFRINKTYLFAIDLHNYGYFWEAHVWFEKLWLNAEKGSDLKKILAALIKISAASLKFQLEKETSFQSLCKKALSDLESIKKDKILGLNKNELIDELEKFKKNKTDVICYRLLIEKE
jgi:hypothetical protein